MESSSTEERIVELERLYMHQQRLVEQLNEALVAQQRELDRLAEELRRVQGFLRGEPWRSDAPVNEKPPHY